MNGFACGKMGGHEFTQMNTKETAGNLPGGRFEPRISRINTDLHNFKRHSPSQEIKSVFIREIRDLYLYFSCTLVHFVATSFAAGKSLWLTLVHSVAHIP